MSENRIIKFEYITLDGVIQPDNCTVSVFTEKLFIIGERTEKVFSTKRMGPVRMTGLFIQYEGIIYGSITTSLEQLLAEIQSCNCIDSDFRIFDDEFDFEFE